MGATDWKSLKRHPLSADADDITGPAWFRFCLRMKKIGFRPENPIYLYEGQVIAGWQRLRACIETGTEPVFQPMPEDIGPADFVEMMDDSRRHETSEETKARRERVAARRQAGESLRTIAEEEGISASQARRDIEAGAGAPGGGAPEKVTGRDGKKQSATKRKPRCNRCIRLYGEESDQFRPGCVECTELRRKKAPDEPPEVQETNEVPPKPIVDDAGNTVPENLLPVFRLVPQFKLFEAQLNRAGKTAKEMENNPLIKIKKPGKHYGEMFGAIRVARFRVRALRPALLCGCDVGCVKCGGAGFFTYEEVQSRTLP